MKHKKLLWLFAAIIIAGLWRYAQQYEADKSRLAAQPVRVVAVGDLFCSSQEKEADCKAGEVTSAIKQENPDAILLPGDLQYEDGDLTEFNKVFDAQWATLKAKSYPSPGNHEYNTPNAQGYYLYWGDQAHDGYYDVTLGNWQVISLDSNCEHIGGCDSYSEQGKWLEQKLKASRAVCTLAFWHHPRFSSGKYKSTQDALDRTQYFWELLDRHHADVIVNGHDHLYERFAPQDINGIEKKNGPRQFTVGTGGKSHYEFQAAKALNHAAGNDTDYGYLLLTLDDAKYSWEFKNTAGAVLDSGSAGCNQ